MTESRPLAAIFGCEGARLSDRERAFFREASPCGFELFQRNCDSPDQIRALIDELRAAVGREDTLILIDQEGGRVRRLKPPHWPDHPSAGRVGATAAHSLKMAEQAAELHARAIAAMLSPLGFDVNAAPVLDLGLPAETDVIGDRAYSADPAVVASLGRAACRGYLAGGITPIIKHMPGHGRAQVDSHRSLPEVTTDWDTLVNTDFVPFRALAEMPWGKLAESLTASESLRRHACEIAARILDRHHPLMLRDLGQRSDRNIGHGSRRHVVDDDR